MALKNNFEYQDLDKDDHELFLKLYTGGADTFMKYGPKGYFLPKHYLNLEPDIYNMKIRPDDIFVASFRRSGTTLTQELVWIIANDFNYQKASEVTLACRYRFLEQAMGFNENGRKRVTHIVGDSAGLRKALDALATPATQVLATSPSPRFIKTHLPLSLLPPNILEDTKVVYVARDPRDVIVSIYHHSKLFKLINFIGSFKDMWNLFIKDLYFQAPYFEHVKEAWALRDHPNLLFLFYEDIIRDMPAAITRVAAFLGKNVTSQQVAGLCDHLSVHNFKHNRSVNYEELRECGLLHNEETFIRQGKAGGWREYFDEEMCEQLERWLADNLLGTDLRFPNMDDFIAG